MNVSQEPLFWEFQSAHEERVTQVMFAQIREGISLALNGLPKQWLMWG